ncbi:MAG: Kelch repeat-containing protein [Promethearchaeota archaeon]
MKKSTNKVLHALVLIGIIGFFTIVLIPFKSNFTISSQEELNSDMRISTLVREDWNDFLDGSLENLTISPEGNLMLDEEKIITANWSRLFPITSPSARCGHGTVYDSKNDKIIIFGGTSGYSAFGETWAYDRESNNWTNMNPVVRPSAREPDTMAYDTKRGKVFLFGGGHSASTRTDQTWIYDYETNNWTNMNPVIRPSARGKHAMAYDSKQDKIVLFGGYDSPANDETWIYDFETNNWTNMNPTYKPNGVYDSAMVYDQKNEKIVLFGGIEDRLYDPDIGYYDIDNNETWVYDMNNSNWTKMNPVNRPSKRSDHEMVYNSKLGKIILYGGRHDYDLYDDAWMYDLEKDEWTQLNSSTTPTSTDYHSMAYDAKRDEIFIFGGNWPINAETWIFEIESVPKGSFHSKVVNLYDIYEISGGISWSPEHQEDDTILTLQVGFSNTTNEDDFMYTSKHNSSFAFEGIGQYVKYSAHFESNDALTTSPILSNVEMFFVENAISGDENSSGGNVPNSPFIPGYNVLILLGMGTTILVILITKKKRESRF